MTDNRSKRIHIIVCALANLLVLCLCTLLWFNVFAEIPVYEEQIVTNGVSFKPTISQVSNYSFSLDLPWDDIPDNPESVTVLLQDADGQVIWSIVQDIDRSLDQGQFTEMQKVESSITLSVDNTYQILAYNGDDLIGDSAISVALYGDQASLFVWIAVVTVLALLITNLIVVLGAMDWKGHAKRRAALGIAILLFMGILSNIAYKPFNVPDENDHFAVTVNGFLWRIDEYNNVSQTTEGIGLRWMQSGIWKDMSNLPVGQQIYSYWYDHDYGNIRQYQETERFQGSYNYPIYGYLPAAIAWLVGVILTPPYQATLFLGRICNYAFFLILILLACKIAPDLRMAILAIATLPSTIWLAASYSYDGWNLGFSILFIAYLWRLATRKDQKIGLPQILMMVLLLLAFAPIKYIYVLLGLLVFAIPGDRWKNRRLIIGAIVVCGVGGIIALRSRLAEAIGLLFTSMSDTRGLEQGLAGESFTVSYIAHHPLQTALTFVKTFYTDMETMVERLLVGEFHSGYVPGYLAVVLGLLFILLMLYSTKETLAGRSRTNRGAWTAWIYRVVLIIGVLAVYGSFLFLYSYHNDGQIGVISGVQGRYFLPLALLLAPAGSAKLAHHCSDWLEQRRICSVQLWAGMMYVSVLIMLCRMPGFVE